MAYCAELGTEPYVCLNMGTGTLEEALAWVEYCNGAGQTAWAARRRENGHDEPFRVRYWGLGNEMYGDWQVGAVSAEEYVRTAARWARAIRRLDPDALLVSCGMNGWNDWDRVVIDGLAHLVDLHSLHIYTGSDDYWANVLAPHQAERAIRCAGALIDRAAYTKKIARRPGIAYDEWNVWFRTDDGTLEERYNFSDALAVGTYLNIFVRNCQRVRMANLAQMVNAIAPIVTSPRRRRHPAHLVPRPAARQGRAGRRDRRLRERPGRGRAGQRAARPVAAPGRRPGPVHPGRRGGHGLGRARPDRAHPGQPGTRGRARGHRPARLVLGSVVFDGVAEITTVTAERGPGARVLPDVEGACVTEGSEKPVGSLLSLTLPPQSFTVIEAATTRS